MTETATLQASGGTASSQRDPIAARHLARAISLADTPFRSRRRRSGGYELPAFERRSSGFATA